MYRYFISFNHSDGGSFGFGHTETTTDFKINGIDAIQKVSQSISDQMGYKNVIIMNFKLFDE